MKQNGWQMIYFVNTFLPAVKGIVMIYSTMMPLNMLAGTSETISNSGPSGVILLIFLGFLMKSQAFLIVVRISCSRSIDTYYTSKWMN